MAYAALAVSGYKRCEAGVIERILTNQFCIDLIGGLNDSAA
jgi:hypothetical protein